MFSICKPQVVAVHVKRVREFRPAVVSDMRTVNHSRTAKRISATYGIGCRHDVAALVAEDGNAHDCTSLSFTGRGDTLLTTKRPQFCGGLASKTWRKSSLFDL